MENMFNTFTYLKNDIQSIAAHFQNEFEGPTPKDAIREFEESMDDLILNVKALKALGSMFLQNKE